jgi:hypothetical protein
MAVSKDTTFPKPGTRQTQEDVLAPQARVIKLIAPRFPLAYAHACCGLQVLARSRRGGDRLRLDSDDTVEDGEPTPSAAAADDGGDGGSDDSGAHGATESAIGGVSAALGGGGDGGGSDGAAGGDGGEGGAGGGESAGQSGVPQRVVLKEMTTSIYR